jgi:type I restriction enzyme R subunit
LQQLLREDHRNIFTLIQKFHIEQGKIYPQLSDRADIIVMTDEAHRTQYDTLALNMRNALPHAAFIGFTGTPLMAGEEKTREVFGKYVSVYNFGDSVRDGTTVPLFYENRIPELQLANVTFNEDMERIVEEAELNEAQQQRLERTFAREYHLITSDDRLERIAEDIVKHFMGRGEMGKAMVVAIDKATAVRMYDKVQHYWHSSLTNLRRQWQRIPKDAPERKALLKKIKFMETTDMAVVVSQSQNEIEKLREKGLDITKHRKRLIQEDLEKRFKDDNDPLRIVFVCAMWMTGFDVPSLSTLYLDKPMHNHTLMQTIARANRVFHDKVNGLIIDYVGVFRDLQKALAIYGSATSSNLSQGDLPVKEKGELVADLQCAITEAEDFCKERDIDIQAILAAPVEDFQRMAQIQEAVDTLVASDESKKQYLSLAAAVARLYKAMLPDPVANTFSGIVALFVVLMREIQELGPGSDISGIMEDIEELLDLSVEAKHYVIRESSGPYGMNSQIDLSQINFDALRMYFEDAHKHIEADKLRSAISMKLTRMVQQNKSRANYQERFQQLIDEYNCGSANVEMFFENLILFAQALNEEDQRHIAEQLNEEELALFDMLTKPDVQLTDKEKDKVKKVARNLLATLKREKLVLDWRKKQQARAQVSTTIKTILDSGLPDSYTPAIFEQKCDEVYQHIYDSYYGQGQSIYSKAG